MIEISQEIPDFQMLKKSESKFMKVIGALLYVITFGAQKDFMDNYVTTIGDKVYIPNRWDEWSTTKQVMILKHERVHMRQAKRYGKLWFGFLYLFAWFPFVFASYRTMFEKEAYKENIKFAFETGGVALIKSDKYKEMMLSYFLTGSYGWMCPFRGKMEEWYNQTVSEIIIYSTAPDNVILKIEDL